MTRVELREKLDAKVERILIKFDSKNQAYGDSEDVFYNFTEGARRMVGKEPSTADAFRYLWALADKHNIAISKGGADTPELIDRLEDVAVYALLGMCMVEDDGEKFTEWGEGDPYYFHCEKCGADSQKFRMKCEKCEGFGDQIVFVMEETEGMNND